MRKEKRRRELLWSLKRRRPRSQESKETQQFSTSALGLQTPPQDSPSHPGRRLRQVTFLFRKAHTNDSVICTLLPVVGALRCRHKAKNVRLRGCEMDKLVWGSHASWPGRSPWNRPWWPGGERREGGWHKRRLLCPYAGRAP